MAAGFQLPGSAPRDGRAMKAGETDEIGPDGGNAAP